MQPSRRRLARGIVACVVCLLLAPVVVAAVSGPDGTELGPGIVTAPPRARRS